MAASRGSPYICCAAAHAATAFRCSWSYPGKSSLRESSLTTLTELFVLAWRLVATAEASAVPVTSTRLAATSVVTVSTPAPTDVKCTHSTCTFVLG